MKNKDSSAKLLAVIKLWSQFNFLENIFNRYGISEADQLRLISMFEQGKFSEILTDQNLLSEIEAIDLTDSWNMYWVLQLDRFERVLPKMLAKTDSTTSVRDMESILEQEWLNV